MGTTQSEGPKVKPKPKHEPRGPRGKKPLPPTNEQDAAIKALSALTKKQLRMKVLTPGQVGALIIRNPRTMEADRTKQRKAKLDKKLKIDPTEPASIPYIPASAGEREVQYLASDVLDYLDRRFAHIDRNHLKRGGPPDPAMRGFQSWLSMADAAQTWPFCIQPDGRPLDMMEAIATDRLNGDPVRLNIREFSDMLAKAANDKQIGEEKASYAKATRKVAKPSTDRKTKWGEPGGPL